MVAYPKIKIPFSDIFMDELEDAFVDKDVTLHKFTFDQLKMMVKDAKAGKLTNTCTINVMENGQIKPDKVKLRDYDLTKYTLESNPTWVPEDIEGEKIKHLEIQVRPKTLEYINLYCQMIGIRFEKYNASLDKAGEERIEHAQKSYDDCDDAQKVAYLKVLEDEKKNYETQKEKREEQVPISFEQAIHSQIYQKLHEEVLKNIDVELDKEFEEIYPKVEKKKKAEEKKKK